MQTPTHAEFSIGFLASRFSVSVQSLESVMRELGVEPVRYVNDVPNFDGAAHDRIAEYVSTRPARRLNLRRRESKN